MKNTQRLSINIFSIFALLLTISFETQAIQENGAQFTIEQLKGLPQNDVNCIFKDSKGFMWIGTLDGLHRFDGYSYKTYQISEAEHSISSNMIIDIDEDSYGNIWVGTYGKGICKLNPVTEEFTLFNTSSSKRTRIPSDDVSSMIIDDNDVIWYGNWLGFYRIVFNKELTEIESSLSYKISESSNLYEDIEVKKIHQDNQGQIWVGTNYNVLRVINQYKPKSEIRFEEFTSKVYTIIDYEDGLLVGGDNISAIQKQSDGNYRLYEISELSANALLYRNQVIWSGNRAGINCLTYSPNSGWKTLYSFNKENSNQAIRSNIVTSLYEDELNQIWVGTRAGGINIINTNPKRFKHYKKTNLSGSIGSNFIQCVFEDHKRNLWIGTEDNGVSVLRRSHETHYANKFQHYEVNPGENENRVYFIDETMTPKSSKYPSVIWLGLSYPLNLTSLNPITMEPIPQPNIVFETGFVFAIEAQNDSVLWVGTYGNGLWRFRLNHDGVITDFKNFTPDDNTESKITSYIIRSLFLDSRGNMWIGTDKGLNRITEKELKKEQPVFQTFVKGEGSKNLSHDYILQIYESINGTIWMGTMGGGLIGYTEEEAGDDFSFSSLREKDGLPNNVIKTILEDNKANLWLSTNNGLSRYNPFNGDIINYDVEDGLQDNEFSEICGFKRANGELVFGGINGFNVFYPNQIVKDTSKPKLFFTDFYILNELVQPGQEMNGKIVLNKSIEYTDKIKLRNTQNSFSLGFVGLHFNAPQKNKYKYLLEGFDKEWTNTGSSYRIAKYTNIPHGDYTFKVMGSNCDNVWVPQPIQIEIRILPPLYLSKVAFLLYILLAVFIVYLIYRFLEFTTQRKKEVLIAELEKKNVEEISQMKLRFFTNISHEFRTPLTLITTPLDKLINKDAELTADDRKQNYQLIKSNTNLMLRLINQLMDFRRLDQNKMKLRIEEIEINEFIENIYTSFNAWAEQKEINFTLRKSGSPVNLWIDPDKVEKIIYNLLSNAFKFTPRQGNVILNIENSFGENQLVISVTDSGMGIEPSELQHIFERYYQPDKKNKNVTGGTGIGLALSKGLADMHKGDITVESEKNSGTRFSLYLNKGNTWFEHIEDAQINQNTLPDNQSKDEYADNVAQADDEVEKHGIEIQKNQFKILLVEDNIELRKVVADIFIENFIIYEADDGEQGLKLCIDKQPDIVISDIMMPNMNGIEMCNSIKNNELISHIPVVLLTAKDTVESQIEGFETGADGYVAKPFNSEVLSARVVSLIKTRESLRRKFQKEIQINPNIIANSPADAKFLDKILALIEEHLSDSEFSVEKLAELYGVSRIYLNRKIKALTGETSNQFLRNIRLKHAAELLKQNVLTVSEVTWEVGYNDLRTFRTRFKEKFGVSPSEYAKNAGGESEEEATEEDNE